MKKHSPNQRYLIIIDIIIFLLSLLGVFSIVNKADLPFILSSLNKNLIITELEKENRNYQKNDQIINISGFEFKTKEEIEIFLDGKNPGEKLKAELQRNGKIFQTQIVTVKYYSVFYIVTACIVGILFFLVAIIVLIKCDNKTLANTFHWAFIFTAIIILMTWGNYSKLPIYLGKATRIGFHIGYLFAPIYFLRFSILFPSKTKQLNKLTSNALLAFGAILSILLSYNFLKFSFKFNLDAARGYILIFDISSIFITILIISSILIFINTYATSKDETERKRMRWIITGFIIGPLGYLLLWVIPTRIWNKAILPESFILLLVAFVPITFGIAIIRYRLMNIDVIIKRGIVYTTVIASLLIIYAIILAIVAKLINSQNSELASIAAAITIALLFQPAKEKVQKFVDRKFFRIEYDYRQALKLFDEEVKNIHNKEILINKVLHLINRLIPLYKIGYFTYNDQKNEINKYQNPNFKTTNEKNTIVKLTLNPMAVNYPVSLSALIEPSVRISKIPFSESDEINKSLILCIKSSNINIHGFLILGEKKSETIFTAEDVDLLNIITTSIGLTLDRIMLQEEVIREHLETERLEELNKIKSYFVSSVSHDLKTPLTSIKLFAERLRTISNLKKEKVDEYLDIIEGESDRLTRLINSVLDYSKIEKGVQKYILQKVNVVEVVKKVLVSLDYQFRIGKFKVVTHFENDKIYVNADEDAIAEALVNLLSNSMKYSNLKKEILVSVYKDNANIIIEIKDFGIGISEEEISNIFEPFFRSSNQKIDKSGGAGLGLSIVKHIMDGHNGKVEVKSKIGEGSTFLLIFPLIGNS
ncbi:MAG: HAMP domain-containing histidine kinase [Ignavibacteriales bacterium]|nr:HAMP domain-containing histidine kinase [Ignavibacteriales bacterium]MCB9259059.1 HAMP domain-containing histidine kinase [Ignavibacteriales bacterium]